MLVPEFLRFAKQPRERELYYSRTVRSDLIIFLICIYIFGARIIVSSFFKLKDAFECLISRAVRGDSIIVRKVASFLFSYKKD